MNPRVSVPMRACLCLLVCLPLCGQVQQKNRAASSSAEASGEEPLVILELGPAMSWTTSGGAAVFAPSLAAETTPIEGKLELEAGVTPFYTRRSSEWDVDFLFKKPWDLSPKAEFMLGVGPGWAYQKRGGTSSQTFSAELAGDFMFWPTGRHHFGWFLEPAYEYSFAGGHPQSLALTGGLLIGLGRRRR